MGGSIPSAGGCCCSRGATAAGAAGAPSHSGANAGAPPSTPSADTSAPSPSGPLTGPAAALAGKSEVQAIDISGWQKNVDWQKVKGAGIDVAYLKASEGTSFQDKTYADKRAGAAKVGIVTGAYDYAKPSTAGGVENSAKAEAEHFLKTANVQKGDLAPALDLEDAGGLSKADLTKWVNTWADTVKAATGVQPVLYTSPSFWKSHVDDQGAADKYRLWIAHWGVNSPDVPGQFHGWSGWQYTSDGSVDGIDGRVDRDKVKDVSSLIVR
jgi:GH25 family lysozyme M1 (1,4-beta-N-acetylmuramidase)